MSNTPTRNVSLTPELEGYIRALVASGRYSNASEVVRSGLRLLLERDGPQGAHLPSPTPTAPQVHERT